MRLESHLTPRPRCLCLGDRVAHDAVMIRPVPRLLVAASLALAACGASAQADDVTIYRCTDPNGALTLGDTPCADDQTQQTRTMLRPKDGDPLPREAATPEAPLSTRSQIVVINAPAPLYECRRDDGSVYTSDSGDGDPRYIDTGGYNDNFRYGSGLAGGAAAGTGPGVAGAPINGSSGYGSRGSGFGSITPVRPPLVGIPQGNTSRTLPSRPTTPSRGGRRGGGFLYGGGTVLVRDTCARLPQVEVCARLRDQRDDLRERFFNAQANERARLNVEERGINARLSEGCGGA